LAFAGAAVCAAASAAGFLGKAASGFSCTSFSAVFFHIVIHLSSTVKACFVSVILSIYKPFHQIMLMIIFSANEQPNSFMVAFASACIAKL
jgi:hypothetical protein